MSKTPIVVRTTNRDVHRVLKEHVSALLNSARHGNQKAAEELHQSIANNRAIRRVAQALVQQDTSGALIGFFSPGYFDGGTQKVSGGLPGSGKK